MSLDLLEPFYLSISSISGIIKMCQFSVFGLYVTFYKAFFICSRIDLLMFSNRVFPFILIDLNPDN